jgi:parallel beta-helix repeat protein
LGGNSVYGLELIDAEKNDISNNDLRNNSLYSIWVSGSCNNSINNNIGGNGGNILYWHDKPIGGTAPGGNLGAAIFCNVHQTIVENLHIDNGNARNDGILLIDSTTTQIRNSVISNSNGIRVIDSEHISIYNNNVISNKNAGISLASSASGRIYSNTIEKNSGSGISLGASHNGEISNNTIRSNAKGIEISYSDNINIKDNTISLNTDDGVAFESSPGGKLFRNEIRQNRLGLFFDRDSDDLTVENNQVCFNHASDIYNNGTSDPGQGNTCAKTWRWEDAGTTYPFGCKNKCVGYYQYYYGYKFENPSKDTLTFGCPYNACQGDMVDTFGLNQVYISAKICAFPICILFWCWCPHPEINVPTPFPDPWAAQYYGIYYHLAARPGSCTGMSTTSLRFYYQDKYPSYYEPDARKVSDLTYTGSLENLIDSKHGAITSWEVINPFVSWLKFYSKGGSNAKNVLNQVKQSIQSGNLGSIVMTSKSLEAHTVVATDVRDYGDHARIYIYDNNLPEKSTAYGASEDDYPYIIVNKSSDTWSYPKNQTFRDEPYAIFFLPHSVANGGLTLPFSQDFLLKGGSLELAGILDFFWGSASSYVEDDKGNKTGRVDGQLLLEIPDAVAMPRVGDVDDSNWEFYVLPVGDHTIHINGNETGAYNTSLFLGQSVVSIEDVESNPDTNDTVTLSYENAKLATNAITPIPILSFETSDADKNYSVSFGERFLASGSVRVYSINNTSISIGSKAIFRVSPDFNSLIYTNRGPREITYTVEMQNSMISPGVKLGDVLPTASRSYTIGPMETHVLTPKDWLNLDTSEINVSVEKCGNGVCGTGEGSHNCPEDCEKLECVAPYDGMHINESTVLCPGAYHVVDGGDPGVIVIENGNVNLDCHGAQLYGSGHGIAIMSNSTNNVTIHDCYIQGFDTGISFKNVTNGTVSKSALVSNSGWGIEFTGTRQSQITQNYIRDNVNGIHISESTDTEVSQSLICPNNSLDIVTDSSANNTGFDNTCDNPLDWDDLGSSGCTFKCTHPTAYFRNGSFEEGFTFVPGVAEGVANGWQYFDNGEASYGWYDDTWPLVVANGKHAQLIEIDDAAQPDRYAGIFQTMYVCPGQPHELHLKGLVRTEEGSGEASQFGHALQVGFGYEGQTDWRTVTDWITLPFEEQPRTGPADGVAFNMGEYHTTVTPTGTRLTLFIRAVKKFPGQTEANYDVDAVSLIPIGSCQSAHSTPKP